MQYTGMTQMFGFVGEMFNLGFKPVAKKFEHAVHNKGDGIVHFWTKSNRPLKLLGFMTGSFVIVAGGIVINRRIQMNEMIPPVSPTAAYFSNQYNTQILPRLQQAINTAFKYAQNGNISLLDPQLDTIAEIVIEYPQFKRFVTYTQSMTFPKHTYFDAKNGGLPIRNEHKQDNIDHMDSKESKSEAIEPIASDTASMILSMDQEALKEELLKHIDTSKDVIKFDNQLDYIRHLCVIRRCEKIYHRGLRHAKKANVQQCADIMAELWEYVCQYEVGAIIIGDDEGNVRKLEEEDLYDVMKYCHRNYVQYLIHSALNIGNKIDKRGLKSSMEGDMNKSLLNMVWKNLENARVYAEKYNVLDDELKDELKNVWEQKELQLKIA